MIATGTGVIANPSDEYKFMILLSPVTSYYSGDVNYRTFSRAANGGIGAAKAAEIMVLNFTTNLANKEGFQQVIWTDDATHTKLEEAGNYECLF
jgi:branched-chain amino acid aminotransferase